MEPTGPTSPGVVVEIETALELFLPVTTLLAVALSGMVLWLVLRIVGERRGNRVSLGTGGVESLERVSRAHGNLVETAPFALVLCVLAEAQGAPWWLLAPTALAFLAGRVLHARAFIGEGMDLRGRVRGMTVTVYALAGLAVTALFSLWPG